MFATWLTARENPFFANAAVNRWWAHFFGRGIVHPIDDFQDDNPPTHPEVLAVLVKEFKASGHDLKHLIRILCNTQAYQRTSRPAPGNENDEKLCSHMRVKVMSPSVLYDALTQALEVSELSQGFRGSGRSFGGGFSRGGSGGGKAEFVALLHHEGRRRRPRRVRLRRPSVPAPDELGPVQQEHADHRASR